MKTVLFFPGQASQYVGMGKDLYEASPEVRRLYELAAGVMKTDIAKLSFEGPQEDLKRTRNTQPAILLHSLAVLTILKDNGPEFAFAAGHSLGEYGALAAAGALSFEDAILAVIKRASLMEEACVKNPSTMAAVIGLPDDKIEAICAQASDAGVVVAANYNSPNQVVISGSMAGIEKASQLLKEASAKRVLPLEVGGAFHSPLMQSATDGLAEYLKNISIATPRVPVVANVTAQPVTNPDEIRSLLIRQVTAPVRWAQTMSFLASQGITRVIEIGPGKVLTGMAKREMSPESMLTLDTLADIQAFAAVNA